MLIGRQNEQRNWPAEPFTWPGPKKERHVIAAVAMKDCQET